MIQRQNSYFLKYLFLSLLLCVGGGWLTGLLTQHGVKEWYPHLIKSYGTPPDSVFPVVWTLLYTLMALALTLLITSHTTQKKTAYLCFGIQLFLNFVWSWIFFYLQCPGLALLDIVLLWLFICLTIRYFWRHTHSGSYLLLPYLAWVTYACYLNVVIWVYN